MNTDRAGASKPTGATNNEQSTSAHNNASRLDRARGCLLGQFIGDALGAPVEFKTAEQIKAEFPDGVRDMAIPDPWGRIPGQVTDDSQMAMMLARSIDALGTFDPADVFNRYQYWYSTNPVDIGNTCKLVLSGEGFNPHSEANGTVMRVSPLGIYCARDNISTVQAVTFAHEEAALTHPNHVVLDANATFTVGIATAIRTGDAQATLTAMVDTAQTPEINRALDDGLRGTYDVYAEHIGWVRLVLGLAVAKLKAVAEGTLTPAEAVVEAIGFGGDTDTNAAITGALVGAVGGESVWPREWVDTVLNAEPELPEVFWAHDLRGLAARLVGH
ncbi:ADP-ribosylglycohydrolase family protein [Corynebacterium sp. H113]|uniref:ADP-ribosylglycohydrolase family protein n=1 Tax=Corynebacterium sp. H113 TaxID=3133419 RepID=UPI00309D5E8C